MSGARFFDYDQLYARYGLVDLLGRLIAAAPPEQRRALAHRMIVHAEEALALVPAVVWHYTDLGAFHDEVTRRAGNALAWQP